MRAREKTLEKRNLEAKNPTKNELKITESLTSMSSTMVDDCPTASVDEKSDKPPSAPSRTSQFFRRFRLSAKTRTKYRNELRRSNSLLEMRSPEDFLDQNDTEKSTVSSLDWLRRRKRPEAENSAQKLEEMYVGNTLLKQKPRLRVRNANLTGSDQTPSSTDPANNSNTPSRKANSLPSNNFKLNPSTTTTSQPAYESDLTRVASTDQAHRSDMEQVLYRAARLRRRRDRSKSNETITRRSKSENHQPCQLEKNFASSGSVMGSGMGSGSDHYGSSTTLHSTTAPLSEDSFLAASSARSYNLKGNPEQGSISTEYDPNSTGSQDCIGESASSGYWSRGEKDTDKDEISLKDSLKDQKIKAPWNIPKVDYIVNRVEVVETRKKTVTAGTSSLFYVALVAESESESGRKPDPAASGYRVRSGYTGRNRNRPGFNRSQSLTRDAPCSEDESVSVTEANEIRRVASEIRDTRRRSRATYNRSSDGTGLPKPKPTIITDDSTQQKFVIQPDDIKVKEDTEKEEWKITIKISRGDSQTGEGGPVEKQTIVKSIPKKVTTLPVMTPPSMIKTGHDMTTQTTPKSSTLPVSSVPLSFKKPVIRDSPVVVKWEQPPKAPVIKTSADQYSRPPLASRFGKCEMAKTAAIPTGIPTGITRKDVLPDLPVRERPRFHARRDVKQNKFKNILSQWEDRINLSRTVSLDVINCGSSTGSSPLHRSPADTATSPSDDSRTSTLRKANSHLSKSTVQKLPPLDAGPVSDRNRLDSVSVNLAKYSSENSIPTPTSSFLNRRFSSTRNCSLPRTFGNIGGMGRHSYRPGCPVGWKAPQ